MDLGLVSNRYAKALLLFSLENKEAKDVYLEMQHLINGYIEIPNFRKSLINPVVTKAEKLELLSEVSRSTQALTDTSKRFFELVLEKNRVNLIHLIATSFETQYLDYHNIVKGRLITPVIMDEDKKNKLIQTLRTKVGKDIEFEEKVDPSLKGGFILECDNQMLDTSLSTQIRELKNRLVKN